LEAGFCPNTAAGSISGSADENGQCKFGIRDNFHLTPGFQDMAGLGVANLG
jgi:hypothetical protein